MSVSEEIKIFKYRKKKKRPVHIMGLGLLGSEPSEVFSHVYVPDFLAVDFARIEERALGEWWISSPEEEPDNLDFRNFIDDVYRMRREHRRNNPRPFVRIFLNPDTAYRFDRFCRSQEPLYNNLFQADDQYGRTLFGIPVLGDNNLDYNAARIYHTTDTYVEIRIRNA